MLVFHINYYPSYTETDNSVRFGDFPNGTQLESGKVGSTGTKSCYIHYTTLRNPCRMKR